MFLFILGNSPICKQWTNGCYAFQWVLTKTKAFDVTLGKSQLMTAFCDRTFLAPACIFVASTVVGLPQDIVDTVSIYTTHSKEKQNYSRSHLALWPCGLPKT